MTTTDMNRSRSRSRAFAAALGAAAVTLSSFVYAADEMGDAPDATLETVVMYADLNLDTDAGVQVLHRRIANAVRRVCPNYDARDLGEAQIVRACREQAMARAVEAIGSTRLAALEASRKPFG
jgi:UrcA family protein